MSGRGDEPLTLDEFGRMSPDVLTGIGPKRLEALAGVEIENMLDLLTRYPRRYLDRSRTARLEDLAEGEEATVLVEVERVYSRRTRGGKSLVSVDVSDGSGRVRCTFFNQPWRERQLPAGSEVVLFGKIERYQGRRVMNSPLVDFAGDQTGRIVALYPQSEKARIASADYAGWIEEILRRSEDRGFADPVPEDLRNRFDLADRGQAFRNIHRPETMTVKEEARRRLVFDELFRVQLALVLRKRALEASTAGIEHRIRSAAEPGALVGAFHDRLEFELTAAQRRAIDEINEDLAGPHPMHRLLQGDVGSGKTVVALSALLVAVEGGHQGAFMAPTEVLAEQHYGSIRDLLTDLTVPDDSTLLGERALRMERLTNRTPPARRQRIRADLAAGSVDLVVGTHALISEGVEFGSLGVIVIDEQHRFGVEQRAALRDRGASGAVPDVLVMTATPIPRTAAMTVYGDLDVSVLDELPPGRTPVLTEWIRESADAAIIGAAEPWSRVRAEVNDGRQVYVVCPLIEGSDKLEAASATETYEELMGGELSGLRVGLLHGRVKAADKEVVMARFRERELDVLVATTVIEVGVDVANATVMVILDADRFGLAQLHQLRGRVGRGADQSYCFLVGEGLTSESEQRLDAMVATTDGFELAEVDLDLRGEGTLMGERQKGRNDLKLASLRRDREWVERAREVAFELVDADPHLAHHRLLADEVALLLDDDDADFLLKS